MSADRPDRRASEASAATEVVAHQTSAALRDLTRWVAAGGSWRVLRQGPPAQVGLISCEGEEMARVESADPSFLAHIQAGQRDADDAADPPSA